MRVLLFLLTLPAASSALNILFYVSAIAQSHIPFTNTAINLLLSRGHTVDLVIARYSEVVKITIPQGVRRNYSYGFTDPEYWAKNAHYLQNIFEKKPTPLAEFVNYDEPAFTLCKIAVNDSSLLEFIKEGQYDIGIGSDYDPCANVIMHAAGVPAKASLIPTPMFQPHVVNAGLPSPASLYGTVLYPKPDGSLAYRIFDLIRHTYNLYIVTPKLMEKYNTLLQNTYGKSFPDVREIEKNIDIILVNSNEIIEKPRPISHKIKYIGGIGKKKPRPLSKELNELLDSSAKGVVLFSFGTQVATKRVPIEIRKNFLTAFKMFPEFLFIWKYDNLTDDMEMFANVPNVHRLEWLPQTDLLGDHRVKAFISHMGLNSFLETSAAGIPVLSIPLFIDQQHNAFNAADREIGVIVDRDQLTVENLVPALRELLNNPKYYRNAQKIAQMMAQKPEQAEEQFIEWIEFTARNPGLHEVFNLPGADLTPFWYYCLDVVVVVGIFMSSSAFVIFKVLLHLKHRLSYRAKTKSD